MKTLILITLTTLLLQCPPTPPPTKMRADTAATLSSDPPCDRNLWAHTYGAHARFGEPASGPDARQILKHRCVTVRGQIVSGPMYSINKETKIPESLDGDVKWKIKVDPLTYMLGFYKEDELLLPGNKGELTVELVCGVNVSNPKCENCRKACDKYKAPYDRRAFDQFTKGKWVDVTGELITDTGPSDNSSQAHGWREIHPVTSIKLVNLNQ